MGLGVDHCLAGETIPHHRNLCRLILCFRFHSSVDDGEPLASRGCPDHWPGISTLYFLHDYRSKDDRKDSAWSMSGRFLGSTGRDGTSLTPGGLRAILCVVPGWANRAFTGHVVTIAAAKAGGCRRLINLWNGMHVTIGQNGHFVERVHHHPSE